MNEHKQREMQMQAASRHFLQALSAGQVGAKDRFGDDIRPGQLLIYSPPVAPIFQVLDVSPVLDPNVPPGALQITMQVRMSVMVGANRPNLDMIIRAQAPAEALTPPGDPDKVDPDKVPEEDKVYRPSLVTE